MYAWLIWKRTWDEDKVQKVVYYQIFWYFGIRLDYTWNWKIWFDRIKIKWAQIPLIDLCSKCFVSDHKETLNPCQIAHLLLSYCSAFSYLEKRYKVWRMDTFFLKRIACCWDFNLPRKEPKHLFYKHLAEPRLRLWFWRLFISHIYLKNVVIVTNQLTILKLNYGDKIVRSIESITMTFIYAQN